MEALDDSERFWWEGENEDPTGKGSGKKLSHRVETTFLCLPIKGRRDRGSRWKPGQERVFNFFIRKM